jgi:hypothetical protein
MSGSFAASIDVRLAPKHARSSAAVAAITSAAGPVFVYGENLIAAVNVPLQPASAAFARAHDALTLRLVESTPDGFVFVPGSDDHQWRILCTGLFRSNIRFRYEGRGSYGALAFGRHDQMSKQPVPPLKPTTGDETGGTERREREMLIEASE